MSSSSGPDGEKELAIRSRHARIKTSGTVSRKENQLTKITRDRNSLTVAEDQVWELIANKMLPQEESELMAKRLERRDDAHTRRTYVNIIPRMRVGLTFLAGADKAQVTRLEQDTLTDGDPDQKNALWRVNTAATLLTEIDVAQDLSLRMKDRTAEIAAKARKWRSSQSRKGSDSPKGKLVQSGSVLIKRPEDINAVTIDSEDVRIVSNLRTAPKWDLEATLIEVDGSSLLGLITNYRWIISRSGPEMDFEENRNLLDIMIENARRLCVRSPIPLRMSTRSQIINSRNTRYGIDHAGRTFRTITTSQGIKEIIRQSAAYYDSLDPLGGGDQNQEHIRPRFLQMLALLLMFLNNEDLRDTQDLLQSTYRIRSTRADIELLILKVVPLSSINPRVFLEALIPVVDQPLFVKAEDPRQAYIWDVCVTHVLKMGYILPAGLDLLGRQKNSWIAKWPEEGFRSTDIFNHLQYNGDLNRTVNTMTTIDLHPEDSYKELTVQLPDGIDYVIESRAIEGITRMSCGRFLVRNATSGSTWGDRQLELEIQEFQVNEELGQAILGANALMDQMNMLLPSKGNNIFQRPKYFLLKNFEGTGRITKHTAVLHQETIATRYKIEDRKVKKRDAWRIMGQTSREFGVLLRELHERARKLFAGYYPDLQMRELDHLYNIVVQQVRSIELEQDYPDEAIQQVLFPDAATARSQALWFDYEASIDNFDRLHLKAQASRVVSCQWLPSKLVDVMLEGHTRKYTAEIITFPGQPEHNEVVDEIQEHDWVALVGNYLVVAVDSEDGNPSFIMTNYLRVVASEEVMGRVSRGGANRANQVVIKDLMVYV